ncbi:MAG TPA: hypothetical protein PL033_02535 [Candidatus Brocadiia bacterium]|nr:hypothetical protein [Candidatus Brocadiia bacterium]
MKRAANILALVAAAVIAPFGAACPACFVGICDHGCAGGVVSEKPRCNSCEAAFRRENVSDCCKPRLQMRSFSCGCDCHCPRGERKFTYKPDDRRPFFSIACEGWATTSPIKAASVPSALRKDFCVLSDHIHESVRTTVLRI